MPLSPPTSRSGCAQLFDATAPGGTTTLDSGASGIGQGANMLLIVIYGRTTQAVVLSSIFLRFNGDSAGNYDRASLSTSGGGAPAGGTGAGATSVVIDAPGASVQANTFCSYLVWVPAYTQTTGHKSAAGSGGWAEATVANDQVSSDLGKWRNTAAINQVSIQAGSGNLAAGSRLTVYGLT